jgi:uncharacterized cupin superfamily protein
MNADAINQYVIMNVNDPDFAPWDAVSEGHTFQGGDHGMRKMLRTRSSGETDMGEGRTHLMAGVWRCGPSEFTIECIHDELLYVVDGEAEVTFESGEKIMTKKGDFMSFPMGSLTSWTVDESWTELFVVMGK